MNARCKSFSELPIIQAPMAGVQDSALAIAVSKAGGVGSLPGAIFSPEALARELTLIRDAGVGIYNVNFFCHEEPAIDRHREDRWRRALAPYYQEGALDCDDIPVGAARQPFSSATLDIIRSFKPPVVSFHFGLPDASTVGEIHSWGGKVWSSATTLAEARWLVAAGADAVIAQGIEAGGHRGMFLDEDLASQTGTKELLKEIRATLAVPVIAAGGIAHPETVQAYLEAGAIAVQVGTAYLCCDEARTTHEHRTMLRSPAANTTQVTNLFSGRPARGITNRLMRELGPMSDLPPAFPLASAALAPLREAAEKAGKTDFSPLWCGTDASGCRPVPAGEQTRWLAGGLRD